MEWVIGMAPGVRPVTGGEDDQQMSIDMAMEHFISGKISSDS